MAYVFGLNEEDVDGKKEIHPTHLAGTRRNRKNAAHVQTLVFSAVLVAPQKPLGKNHCTMS